MTRTLVADDDGENEPRRMPPPLPVPLGIRKVWKQLGHVDRDAVAEPRRGVGDGPGLDAYRPSAPVDWDATLSGTPLATVTPFLFCDRLGEHESETAHDRSCPRRAFPDLMTKIYTRDVSFERTAEGDRDGLTVSGWAMTWDTTAEIRDQMGVQGETSLRGSQRAFGPHNRACPPTAVAVWGLGARRAAHLHRRGFNRGAAIAIMALTWEDAIDSGLQVVGTGGRSLPVRSNTRFTTFN